jgi:DNA-binding Lrp family transcriptional regulator
LRNDNLKDVELKLISELMKNSRRSDRELAKALGVSQPTITRTRTRLERQGLIEYTAIPNLSKLGYDLLVFTLVKYAKYDQTKHSYDMEEMGKKFHEISPTHIFGACGQGAGYDRIGISVHKNFTEYSKYLQRSRDFWKHDTRLDTFIVELKTKTVAQRFSFKPLADHLQRDATSIKTERSNQKVALVNKDSNPAKT